MPAESRALRPWRSQAGPDLSSVQTVASACATPKTPGSGAPPAAWISPSSTFSAAGVGRSFDPLNVKFSISLLPCYSSCVQLDRQIAAYVVGAIGILAGAAGGYVKITTPEAKAAIEAAKQGPPPAK